MRIAFFGHADFVGSADKQEKLIEKLLPFAEKTQVDLLFGGYGGFDSFALVCGKILKSRYPQTRLLLVTPYLSLTKNSLCQQYDEIIYPPIEKTPLRFAISARNKWICETADLIFIYTERSRGGAYQALCYALRKGKSVIQLNGYI